MKTFWRRNFLIALLSGLAIAVGLSIFIPSRATLDPLNSTKYSIAYGINYKGQVVGRAISSSGVQQAFLWQNDTMRDLNSLIPRNSGWELFWAADINNRGQIVGYGQHNGQTRASLLTPIWVTR